ncbi:hypothetical protein T492DRAFT_341797 [Pavlovales sp. CCMP2436]|nr:hypothetical protein T492DRAFT_341797 [Pavlovales sp. CCMP2436]
MKNLVLPSFVLRFVAHVADGNGSAIKILYPHTSGGQSDPRSAQRIVISSYKLTEQYLEFETAVTRVEIRISGQSRRKLRKSPVKILRSNSQTGLGTEELDTDS